MPDPLVSVLMAAYNHEKFVEEAVRSVISQTYKNLELIIIDDGSQDGTYQKIMELRPLCEQRFARFVVMHQDNSGIGLTLNKLIELAQGEYSFFIASDDVAKPEAIETLVDFMVAHGDYVTAVGDNEFIDEDSKVIGWDKKRRNVSPEKAYYKTFGAYLRHARRQIDFLSDEFGSYATLVQDNYIPNGSLTRTAAQKQRAPHTDEAPLEDWYMHLQLAKIGKMKYIDKVLLSYRQHSSNTFRCKDTMRQNARKTRLYEQKLVHRPGMEHWAEIFDHNATLRKTKFRLGNLIHCYKQTDMDNKADILEIFGRRFVLKQKAR